MGVLLIFSSAVHLFRTKENDSPHREELNENLFIGREI